jgi:lysophospholipase L1-like esterase
MRRSGAARRVLRAAARALTLLALVAVSIELALQAIALVAIDRHTAWRPGATERVLCVGDSHTYGAGVRAEEAYPAQLQSFLDEAAPGVYSVMNRGVPGFTTTQVRRRLPEWIAELDPTIVVVIAGANNVWNLAEMDVVDSGWRARVAAWALRLRTVRLVQSWRAQRALDSTLDINNKPFGDRPKYLLGPDGYVDWGDGSERLRNDKRKGGIDLSMMQDAVSDYEAIARLVRARGVRLLFLGYPFPNKLFTPLTTAMELIAKREHVEFVDGAAAVRRVPPDQLTITFGVHSGPAGLTEIGRDIARTILAPAASSASAPGS